MSISPHPSRSEAFALLASTLFSFHFAKILRLKGLKYEGILEKTLRFNGLSITINL